MNKLLDELKREIHVWYCDPRLIQQASKLKAYESVLSDEEVERYQRFHFDKDRHNYLVSHALLRYTLSLYADIPASNWKFEKSEHGKPTLVLPAAMPAISFNLTHTEGLAACVVAVDIACGIDAENKNRKNRLAAVANRMFADEEIKLLNQQGMKRHFFYYWTLREAYVKALGTGLSGSSKEFYFDVDLDEMKAVLCRGDSRQVVDHGWQFRLYEPTSENVVSVAYKSSDPLKVKLRELIP